MTSRITTAFSIFQAKTFIDFFESLGEEDTLYAFTSDPTPVNDNPENDLLPPNPSINQQLAKEAIYENALTAVKINPSSASRATKRFNWALGEKFVPYSNEINVLEHDDKFYCLVEIFENGNRNLRVYKCLYAPTDEEGNILPVGWNNIEGEDYRPRGDINQPVVITNDDYIWNYMYSILPFQETLFLDRAFIPIPETPTENLEDLVEGTQKYEIKVSIDNAEKGTIYNTTILDTGSFLNDGSYTLEVFNGTPEDNVITEYKARAIIKNGQVKTVLLINAGKGYIGDVQVRLPQAAINNLSELPNLQVDLSPDFGHASDPVNELGGNFIIINARKYFSADEKIPVTRNDFRTLSIVKNPIDESTGNIAKREFYDLTYKMKFSNGIEGVYEDSRLIKTRAESSEGERKTVEVVGVGFDEGEKDGSLISVIPKGLVYPDGTFNNSKEPSVGEFYRVLPEDEQTQLNADVLIEYRKPLIRPFSGEIFLIEHRKPLNRIDDQIESYSFIFSF